MQRSDVAGIDRRIDRPEHAFPDGAQQVFRSWLAAASRLVTTVSQQLAHGVVGLKRRGGFEEEVRKDGFNAPEGPERNGKRRDERHSIEKRMRVDGKHVD